MPQATLPLFTSDMTIINRYVGVQKKNNMVYYYCGILPFCHHREDDRASFKHVVCQMLSNNMVARCEIHRAFNIPERSISRWLATFKEKGEDCFFVKKK
jgi:hypothetical protein